MQKLHTFVLLRDRYITISHYSAINVRRPSYGLRFVDSVRFCKNHLPVRPFAPGRTSPRFRNPESWILDDGQASEAQKLIFSKAGSYLYRLSHISAK